MTGKSVEKCENCGRVIATNEPPSLWRGKILCAQCRARLEEYPATAPGQLVSVEGKQVPQHRPQTGDVSSNEHLRGAPWRRWAPQGYAKAMAWLRGAAAKAVGLAMYSIGVLYDHGAGLARAHAKAMAWYRRAAAFRRITKERWFGIAKPHQMVVHR